MIFIHQSIVIVRSEQIPRIVKRVLFLNPQVLRKEGLRRRRESLLQVRSTKQKKEQSIERQKLSSP